MTDEPSAVDDPAVDEEEVDPREQARIRRRDHDADAEARDLLRPGMGKVFKQILDRQGRVAREQPGPEPRRRRKA